MIMDNSRLRSDFGSGHALVPVPQTVGLGRYAVCAWFLAVGFVVCCVYGRIWGMHRRAVVCW